MALRSASNLRVIYLVDNKRRDLAMATLIAYHLSRLGIDCLLEPLEAYQAVLALDRPDMIIFNHLTASHLARYSKRLHALGVRVAVLQNEGILYKEEVLKFNAGRFHRDAHIDLFFSWNELFRDALISVGIGTNTQIEVVGVPRFDYYFKPWMNLYAPKNRGLKTRPQVLVCTNFVFSKYGDLPAEEATELFKNWASRIEVYQDYSGAVQVSHRSRERLFSYLEALLACDEFEVVLRPHPNEDANWYRRRVSQLPRSLRNNLRLEIDRNITSLILECDIEISMDSCTTALESWIAGKPTLDLALERHPLLSNPMLDPLNLRCEQPEDLPAMVRDQLANPTQDAFQKIRMEHLAQWCASPRGDSSERVAKAIYRLLQEPREIKNFIPTLSDQRRALKLRVMRFIGKPYNWKPQLNIQAALSPTTTQIKQFVYEKTITPNDVKVEMENLKKAITE